MTIKKIIILGGGTAGWMTAAALSQVFSEDEIILIEAPDIPSVGVGEATIPHIIEFNNRLGIDEKDFMRATKATFKLGILFEGWKKPQDAYFHPFGTYGPDFEGISFHQYWLKSRAAGNRVEYEKYCLSAVAAEKGKFSHPSSNPRTVLSTLKYAFHFDAGLYAQYLREYACAGDVKHHEGIVKNVTCCPKTGDITALVMEDGLVMEADFFIDCSGFGGLLIEKTLKAGYEDWSQYLPCDSAIAAPTPSGENLQSYTQTTARSAGWQWKIPLQHRTGNGYVYASRFQSDEAARNEFLGHLDAQPISEPKQFKFTTGRRKAFWKNNCVAIGLSAGFLEPLESTSIHLIQVAISQLIALFPRHKTEPAERDQYNKSTALQYERARDFLILHYYANERYGEPLWDYCRTMELPTHLKDRLDLFKISGRFFKDDGELFDIPSWTAVAFGQGFLPKHCDPIIKCFKDDKVYALLERVRHKINETATGLQSHKAYVDKYCGVSQSPSQWTDIEG